MKKNINYGWWIIGIIIVLIFISGNYKLFLNNGDYMSSCKTTSDCDTGLVCNAGKCYATGGLPPICIQKDSSLDDYLVALNKAFDNKCSKIGENSYSGVTCSYDNQDIDIISFTNSNNNPCINDQMLNSKYSLVTAYKGFNIYFPKEQTPEPSTSFYYTCDKNRLLIQAPTRSILTKYIDRSAYC